MRSRRCRSTLSILLLASTMLLASAVAAAGAINGQAAAKIIDGCAAHAKGKRQSHAIVVYDDGGHLVAALRMDGNPPGITEFAMSKARAVAYWQLSTAEMANAARETPGFRDAPHVVTVPGGVPVFSADGKQFVGAVGVSGESTADDVACAVAGVAASGFSVTRKAAS